MKNSKIILLDIETNPIIGQTYGLWKQNVRRVLEDWSISGFAYKELGSNKVEAFFGGDEKDLVDKLHKVMSDAEVIVAHNADRFDLKKINTRLIYHGYQPPEPYKTVDTLKVCKKYFAFSSNSLNYVCKQLGLGGKVEVHPDVWENARLGDEKAINKMIKYNKQDVVLLEKLYLKLRPYIKNHPLTKEQDIRLFCKNCNSHHLRRAGTEITKTKTKQKYQCLDCGAWQSV